MNWEYSVELISFIDIAVASKALNKWGRDGWEVAAIIPGVGGKEENWTVVILKRPGGLQDSRPHHGGHAIPAKR